MGTRENLNDQGRQPGDPSPELLSLIHYLQHKKPDDDTVFGVSGEMYRQALELIEKTGNREQCVKEWDDVLHVRFCGHLISPENFQEQMPS